MQTIREVLELREIGCSNISAGLHNATAILLSHRVRSNTD